MTMNDKTSEWVRWIVIVAINVMIIISSIIMAYGSLDKRVTTIEVKQSSKVDGLKLELKLKEWKNEILHEIKEFNNDKNNNKELNNGSRR